MSCNKYNFHHLVLLVGTNPLPNFVVADYFLKHNEHLQKIWLIYSKTVELFQTGTYSQAKNLAKLLQKKWEGKCRLQFPFETIQLSDVSNAAQIKRDIPDEMIKELENSEGFHLNYTGGTKAMSTHVYRILEQVKNKEEKAFSYLDARKFRIIGDKEDFITDDLRNEITITFEDLIELHEFKRCNKDSPFNFSQALEEFEQIINKNELNKFYEKNGGYYRKLFINDLGELLKVGKLDKNKIERFIPNKTFLSIILNMPEQYRLFDDTGKFNWKISDENFKESFQFIDGIWLEHYIAKIIKQNFSSEKIKVLQDWKIQQDGWGKNDFQLDAILITGYHLTGISCTTSYKKDICKNKGFEIIHRVKQIGGDEAKAILITRLDEDTKKNVQKELKYDTGGRENILVLGINDLKKTKVLVNNIKDFLK